MRTKTSLLALSALLFSTAVSAQNVKVLDNDRWCTEDNSNHTYNGKRSYKHCEVREITLSDRDRITVDGRVNGGIKVQAWDKDEILIRAKVRAWAPNEEDAYELAQDVKISTRGTIEANNPGRNKKRQSTSVSYELYVPKESNLDLNTHNGGVSIADVEGDINFKVLNGGAKLTNLAGKVTGRATNGGLKIYLTGNEWLGEKMDVETTNGGVVLYVPDNYNADLEAGTVNGGMDFDFPVSVSGRINRRVSVTLGDGGKTIRAFTTNGGVKIKEARSGLSKL